jgi:hypothetical protein
MGSQLAQAAGNWVTESMKMTVADPLQNGARTTTRARIAHIAHIVRIARMPTSIAAGTEPAMYACLRCEHACGANMPAVAHGEDGGNMPAVYARLRRRRRKRWRRERRCRCRTQRRRNGRRRGYGRAPAIRHGGELLGCLWRMQIRPFGCMDLCIRATVLTPIRKCLIDRTEKNLEIFRIHA